MADPSSFTITELTGPANVLVLQGRALPYRPLEFTGEMRVQTIWYPGNPVATVQLLGAKEEPSTINGMWKDRFVSSVIPGAIPVPVFNPDGKAFLNGAILADSMAIVQAVDGFRRRGQLLRVQWDELTRDGILTSFKHKWLRREDVEWEITFTWISQSDPLTPIATGIDFSLPSVVSSILSDIQAVQAALTSVFALVAQFGDAITNALDNITIAFESVQDTATKLQQAILTPYDAAKATIAAFQTIQDQAQEIYDTVTSVPPKALVNEDVSQIDLSTEMQAVSWSRNMKRTAITLRNEAVNQSNTLASRATGQEIIGTVIARAGEDLREIADLFYDSTDEWHSLATFNRIKGSVLTAGQVILVPSLSSGSIGGTTGQGIGS